ncbi:hypothetical protein E0493_21285 [Roseomonas sp. M0104]|uniref:Uncharacterized protein n=1 Tax=Teichococcus coralli TaxID=2545983 RepID=A0A845BFV1_9PROT|nr:hypothetical protein [Pseudoroseomonas coralli]MXP65885.1 hypothetical protein [Pseudoroseomonas coralli]
MTMIAAAALGSVILAPLATSAALASVKGPAPAPAVQMVQYWTPAPYDGGWERRPAWREWRRERDEARIAEAARREAWRIEQEREQRRAWREQQYGYGRRHGRGW